MRPVTLLAAPVVAVLWLCCAQPCSASDAAPLRTVSIPVDFDPLHSPDGWSNGFWVGYKRGLAPGQLPEFRTFDREGNEVLRATPLSLPDAYHTVVHAAAATREGDVIASAEVWSSPGEKAPALCKISRSGEVLFVARTDKFLGRSLAVTPDGDIWSLGSRLRHPLDPKQDYEVLERYDATGKLKSRALLRSSFGVKFDPAILHDFGEPRVVASATRVGVVRPGARAWAELSPTGEVLDRFTVDPPAAPDGSVAELARLVMSDDSEVYAYFVVARPAGST
jgi:hypothetical protein